MERSYASDTALPRLPDAAPSPFRLEVGTPRERLLGSNPGDRQGRVEIRACQGSLLRHAFGQKYSEAADKRISRARRVGGGDREGPHETVPGGIGQQRTAAAQGEDAPPKPLAEQRSRACCRLGLRAHRQSGEQLGFGLVRNEIVRAC